MAATADRAALLADVAQPVLITGPGRSRHTKSAASRLGAAPIRGEALGLIDGQPSATTARHSSPPRSRVRAVLSALLPVATTMAIGPRHSALLILNFPIDTPATCFAAQADAVQRSAA
jgi:hypothetical protein